MSHNSSSSSSNRIENFCGLQQQTLTIKKTHKNMQKIQERKHFQSFITVYSWADVQAPLWFQFASSQGRGEEESMDTGMEHVLALFLLQSILQYWAVSQILYWTNQLPKNCGLPKNIWLTTEKKLVVGLQETLVWSNWALFMFNYKSSFGLKYSLLWTE